MKETPHLWKLARFGAFEVDLDAGELRKHGLKIRLQEQPFRVLTMLLERPGRVVTREDIQRTLWPDDTVVEFDHGINAAINRLRDALSDSADEPRYVETLPRRGYRFIAPAERVARTASHQAPSPQVAASTRPRPDTGELTGNVGSRYRILEKLGAGGMGVVYKAEDTRLGRLVALKVIGERLLPDPRARARLLREARTASALNHPHVCTIYDVGEADGRAYIAMEYIEGRPLAGLVQGAGLPTDLVVRYGTHIADALAHAHERGVIHRDLKTSNVMITPEGRAKVLDFGLAKRLEGTQLSEATRSEESLTQVGAVLGTLHYMAPEVLRGKPAGLRSDIWTLGVVLYEMAAGWQPFEGDTGFELTSAILRDPPKPLPAWTPSGLRSLIHRCLEKQPDQRYEEARDVKAALRAAQFTPPVIPEAPPPPPPPQKSTAPETKAEAGSPTAPEAVLSSFFGFLGQTVKGVLELVRGVLGAVFGLVIAGIVIFIILTGLGTGPEVRRGIQQGLMGALRAIADELNIRLPSGEQLDLGGAVRRGTQLIEQSLQSGRTIDPGAYDAYVQGISHLNRLTEEDLKSAARFFEQAIEQDSDYAYAYAGLADAVNLLAVYGGMPPQEAYPKANEAAEKALALMPGFAEAHNSLALASMLHRWDWADAAREFESAIELKPDYPAAQQWYAAYLAAMGRHEEALRRAKRAQELRPRSAEMNANAGYVLYLAGQYELALEEFRKSSEGEESFPLERIRRGMTFAQLSLFDQALGECA